MQVLTSTNEPIKVLFGEEERHESWRKGRYYERVPIYVETAFGSRAHLFLKTAKCFSLGAKQNIDRETGEAYGWVLQICLLEGGNEEEQLLFLHALEDVVSQVKEKTKTLIEDDDVAEKVAGCLWRPPNVHPILYAKINDNKRRASLYNSSISKVDDILQPTKSTLMKKEDVTECCYVQAIICIDSIILYEDKAHLKVQVYEANIQDLPARQSFL